MGSNPKVLKAIVGISRDTTANWNSYPDFIPRLGEVIAYLDRFTVTEGNTTTLIPDLKVGDGVHHLIDLPFVGDRGPEEATKTEIINILNSAQFTSDSSASATPNYTPEGTISKPNVNVLYSINNGTVASCTFPELNMSVTGETLNLEWTNGSFIPNSPTDINYISAELATTPTFTGKPTEISASFDGA